MWRPGAWYYIVILVLIACAVGYFLYIRKKLYKSGKASEPPQRGIIK